MRSLSLVVVGTKFTTAGLGYKLMMRAPLLGGRSPPMVIGVPPPVGVVKPKIAELVEPLPRLVTPELDDPEEQPVVTVPRMEAAEEGVLLRG